MDGSTNSFKLVDVPYYDFFNRNPDGSLPFTTGQIRPVEDGYVPIQQWTMWKKLESYDIFENNLVLDPREVDMNNIFRYWSKGKIEQANTKEGAAIRLRHVNGDTEATKLIMKNNGIYYIEWNIGGKEFWIHDHILMYYDAVYDALVFNVLPTSEHHTADVTQFRAEPQGH
ncbi:hypothetical protein CDL15_Pgr006295 [Punica granatum]|uniref:Uncharacterized protein n=1 Tax=Punica granatum TaxID=22663 RepID=A0A218X667_PUNGR|nr:hypothetical protein CDL15_Pgr006295 [Punica granatum]PKI47341.1 hypothetical protein CRG98_032266 [Punica granatum]